MLGVLPVPSHSPEQEGRVPEALQAQAPAELGSGPLVPLEMGS